MSKFIHINVVVNYGTDEEAQAQLVINTDEISSIGKHDNNVGTMIFMKPSAVFKHLYTDESFEGLSTRLLELNNG
jgi:hypothetical protein